MERVNMNFTLKFNMNDDAFFDESDAFNAWTVSDTLSSVQRQVNSGKQSGIIRDINGNKIGQWSIQGE